jgi:hypothetical protein
MEPGGDGKVEGGHHLQALLVVFVVFSTASGLLCGAAAQNGVPRQHRLVFAVW